MFTSAPKNFERRKSIRIVLDEQLTTWEKIVAKEYPEFKVGSSIKALFFVGDSEGASEEFVVIKIFLNN